MSVLFWRSVLRDLAEQACMFEEADIGKNIKSLRVARSLTLEALANRTGYTKGYLSKVENSKKSPPVSTLIVIAKALGVTLPQIFGEDVTTARCAVVTKEERHLMARSGDDFGYAYETLAHKYPNKKMMPSILTLPGGSKSNKFFQHEGEEMMLVFEGRMRFFHGEEVYILNPGDCVYFDSGIPHRGVADGDQEVKCVMVIYTP